MKTSWKMGTTYTEHCNNDTKCTLYVALEYFAITNLFSFPVMCDKH
jgi:hypothetical protein